ncbi:DUF6662 family protein [Bdellovibrio svalbardensis]|uniref:Transporter n=1 Tax=Bdellovibrio svalbardensis TaxID=2972972 RepID=A0ABT6DMT1_9BACT|nr:DUF6662 family protein [Bdellovibrio svalbardensis]MDG0818185.1 hypothetical protein [Bdellovibrio svalbardensis]
MKLFKLMVFGSLFAALTAQASEGIFGYSYTADTHGKGQWEYEQYNTLRSGKSEGDYNALDVRFELETGITDNLQMSAYINTSYVNIHNSGDLTNINEFDVNGMSLEFIYNVLSPYKDSFGLSLYLEPEISVRSEKSGQPVNKRAVDAKLLLQKNFLENSLITVLNLKLEPEWKREGSDRDKSLEAGISAGIAYLFQPKTYVGLEIVNDFEYEDMNFADQEFYTWSVGPTIHYASESWWWTLTALPQVSGWPKTDGNLNLDEKEKFQVRFKFGIPLGG